MSLSHILSRTAPRVLLATTLAAALARPAHAEGFAWNGWQLHDYNVPKLEEAIRRAPSYGVQYLIFSHELFRSVEGFLASDDNVDLARPSPEVQALARGEHFRIIPGWKSDLRRLGELATQQHLPYYLWVHEFDDVPRRFLKEGRVAFDDPALFEYLQRRYERLLDAMPGTAGFVLTLHESDLKVFRHGDIATRADVPERIHKVARLLYDLLKKRGKQLIVRNFFYEPLEMEQWKAGIARLPDDVIVMSKDTAHEFHPFYPWDPLHGGVGKKRQIVEIDLGVEKAWDWHGAYAQVDYLHRAAVRAHERGLYGMVGRARLMWDQPFSDMHEVNLYAFGKLGRAWDASTDSILRAWAGARYPAAAVPYIVSACKRSEFINHYGRWHLEYWFTKEIGREWGDYAYVYSRVLQRARSKWSGSDADRRLEEKLYHPDDETYARVIAEKDQVVAQVDAALGDLRQASRYLTAAQMAPWREDFRFLQDAALLQREWVRAWFAHRRYMDEPRDEYRRTMNEALDKLAELERAPGMTYGLDAKTGRRYEIDVYAKALRERTANRKAALADDARILRLTRTAADVANR
jgi:hypothetical protein